MSEALVIGAGHNGLVAALALARAGRRVTVLERRGEIGGTCAPRPLAPGYTVPGLLHDTTGLRRDLVRALGLEDLGLAFETAAPSVLAAHSEHRGAVLHAEAGRSRGELEALHKGDGDAYVAWRAFVSRVGGFVAGLLDRPPPPLRPRAPGEWWSVARLGLALRRLGRADMLELLRVAPMGAADWLQEQFRSPLVCAALAAPGLAGAFLGPRASGSAAALLCYEAVRGGELLGGPAALAKALGAALERAGGRIRLDAEVTRIGVERGRVSGVELADGAALEAPLVVACCDPKRALLGLLAPATLPLAVEEALRAFRTRGTAAKVELALDGPLVFRDRPGERHARAVVADGLDEVERAFDAAKYRACSERPLLDLCVPSVGDASLAPPGKDVVSILAYCAPRDLEGGWSDAARARFGDAVVDALERAAPGTRDRVLACRVVDPEQIERVYGASGGHIHCGEHALDQLFFMRPTPALARYATPVAGLYLGGSGSHPGGGVTGRPGALAARAVLSRRGT